jgi:hypothetical protein
MAGKLIEYPFDTVKVCAVEILLMLRFVCKLSPMANLFNFVVLWIVFVRLSNMRDFADSTKYQLQA